MGPAWVKKPRWFGKKSMQNKECERCADAGCAPRIGIKRDVGDSKRSPHYRNMPRVFSIHLVPSKQLNAND